MEDYVTLYGVGGVLGLGKSSTFVDNLALTGQISFDAFVVSIVDG